MSGCQALAVQCSQDLGSATWETEIHVYAKVAPEDTHVHVGNTVKISHDPSTRTGVLSYPPTVRCIGTHTFTYYLYIT
jgi:hypothetical protein